MKNQKKQQIDYKTIGLKVGLEVHQQLLTDRKMFCHCPAGVYTTEHDGVVLRHMRPTLSELGVFDGAALMEFKTKKQIIYLLNNSNVCTYEMDDTPPFLMNQDALDIAIEQCLMFDTDIVDEVHVARKQYLDGSIPTGFQRTAIIGVNGSIPFKDRKLDIIQISIEEDSCREVIDKGHLIVWRTDRLGMPLIEIVTEAQLYTPDEVLEAILLIGRTCRSTNHVRFGIGASRQDVNVSVHGGQRVEIKGVPRAALARDLVHGEAIRQVNLLQLRTELHKRGFNTSDDLKIKPFKVTKLFKNSKLDYLTREGWNIFLENDKRKINFEIGKGEFTVMAIKLEKLGSTINWPTQPGHTFADELKGRIRVVSCLDQPPFMIHSEDWPEYNNSSKELEKVMKITGCGPDDSVAVVWGPEQDTLSAVLEIRIRYSDAIIGIPNETRQALADGSTDFERILPGPDRMYPDTDSPPIRITRERVTNLLTNLPLPPWVREKRYGDAGVSLNTTYYLIRRGGASLVDRVIDECKTDLKETCIFFGEKLKHIKRSGVDLSQITPEKWFEYFNIISKKPVLSEAWKKIVSRMAEAPDKSITQIIDELSLNVKCPDWKKLVHKTVTENLDSNQFKDKTKFKRFVMGEIMKNLRGKIPGCTVELAVRTKLYDLMSTGS